MPSLSPQVFPGYVRPVAEATAARARVSEIVNAKLGQEALGEAEIVTVRGNGIPSSLPEL